MLAQPKGQTGATLFVASSSEGRPVAEAVRGHLMSADLDIYLWSDPGVFDLSDTAIESLENAIAMFDFAVMVLSPDDIITSRGHRRSVPRDNLIFELGLFVGAIGRKRAFMLVPAQRDFKLPTDLAGVTVAYYRLRKDAWGETPDVGAACGKLLRAIRRAPTSRLESVLGSLVFPPVVLRHCLWQFEAFLRDPRELPLFRCDAQVTVLNRSGKVVAHAHPSAIGHDATVATGKLLWASIECPAEIRPFKALADSKADRGWMLWIDAGYSLLYTPLSRRDNQRLCLIHFRCIGDNIYVLECHHELSSSLDPSLESRIAATVRGRVARAEQEFA